MEKLSKHEAEYAFNCKFPRYVLSGTTQAELDMSIADLKEEFKRPLNEIVDEFGYTTIWMFKNKADQEVGMFTYVIKLTKEKEDSLRIFLAGGYKNIFGNKFNIKSAKDMEKATIIIPIAKVEQFNSWEKIFKKFKSRSTVVITE